MRISWHYVWYRGLQRSGWDRGISRGGSNLKIFLHAQDKTLLYVWITLEQRQNDLPGKFRHPAAVDGGYRDSLSISQQIQAAGKVVASLAIGDNAFATFALSRAYPRLPGNFDKTL